MISASDRRHAIELIDEAKRAGASESKACEELGISHRTLQRWRHSIEDQRPRAMRPTPAHKLSEAEREQIRELVLSEEFQSLPPSQIVPTLADRGIYVASESTFYRFLRENRLQHHRGSSRPANRTQPTTHQASGPNQVWTWDITWLPAQIRGTFYYLYLIVDVYSRKIVGHEVWETESAEQASQLVRRTALREQIQTYRQPLVLHSDNGSPMKGATLQVTLAELGISSSRSRPRVSNDNAYSESLFRTLKYRPEYPVNGFASLEAVRNWVQQLVRWYNETHRHSGLNFVTPNERHQGKAAEVLAKRKEVYEAAKAANPARWSRETRDWSLEEVVTLNPDRSENELASIQKKQA